MSERADDAAGPAADVRYKRPESVLVVVHTAALECLLLKRVQPADFWQSVTGSLRWEETPAEAAARELLEETGLAPVGLVDAGTRVRFPIRPEWRHRYRPDVESNLEHWFYVPLPGCEPIRLNPREHDEYAWLEFEAAAARVASWTNRAALERLRRER